MDTQPTIVLPEGSLDLGNQLPDFNSIISDILGPIMWVSIAFTVLFVILYTYSMMRRRKVESAILDIQKVLHEMNEREKARTTPLPSKVRTDSADSKIIATNNQNIS